MYYQSALSFRSQATKATRNLPTPESVFVGGISKNTTRETLTTALSQLGLLKKADIFSKRGFAIVKFETSEATKLAVSTHWITIDNKRVELLPFESSKKASEAKS